MFGSRLAAIALVLSGGAATADEEQACRVIETHVVPASDLQLVAWLEDEAGTFIDTVFITQVTGTYGLGNRPGIMDFNSGPRWPYGRREAVFPVWAHRHGLVFPRVEFQNTVENNLSHPFAESSREAFYCRPIRPDEELWDATSCASEVYTDKGKTSATATSLYPPRQDIELTVEIDDPSVETFDALNPFDAVSHATPAVGAPFRMSWAIPPSLVAGNYVLWIEAAQEFDHNEYYNPDTLPPPASISWSDYGEPYRGQPSVIYRVPFVINSSEASGETDVYAGYGDPLGLDGALRPPDATITVGVAGSGADRLRFVIDGSDGSPYRVKVISRNERDGIAPAAVANLRVVEVTHRAADLSFVAAGDDEMVGQVTEYLVRHRAGDPMTEDNFMASAPVSTSVSPLPAGQLQTLHLDGLLPETTYFVGVRAIDNCGNKGPLATLQVTTAARAIGEVDACFVATAAFGSVMANDVVMLRRVRDALLRSHVLGELAVETYYTFSPGLAGVVGESELLRATSRAALRPLVERLRSFWVPAVR
jgi:hypothetical protein